MHDVENSESFNDKIIDIVRRLGVAVGGLFGLTLGTNQVIACDCNFCTATTVNVTTVPNSTYHVSRCC